MVFYKATGILPVIAAQDFKCQDLRIGSKRTSYVFNFLDAAKLLYKFTEMELAGPPNSDVLPRNS